MADNPGLNSKCSVCGLSGKYITVWFHVRDKTTTCYAEDAKPITNFVPEPEPEKPEPPPVIETPLPNYVVRHPADSFDDGQRAVKAVEEIIYGSQDEPPSMAELAASSGGFGDFDGGASILEEQESGPGDPDPEPEYLGEDAAPTFLTRDGLVAMPAWVVAFFDSYKTIGYVKTFRDFCIEWIMVGMSIANIDVRLLPVSEDERMEILAALGIFAEEALVG